MAAAYLESRGLITGTRTAQSEGPVRAKITSDGTDCVDQFDGEVQAYISRPASAGSPTITIGTFNNHGRNTAIASTGVNQQVSGVDAAGFAEFARVLIDGLVPQLADSDLRAEIRAVLEEIQNEAKAQAEPGKLTARPTSWGATSRRRVNRFSLLR